MVVLLLNQDLKRINMCKECSFGVLGKSGQIAKIQYMVGGDLKCNKHAKKTVEWN